MSPVVLRLIGLMCAGTLLGYMPGVRAQGREHTFNYGAPFGAVRLYLPRGKPAGVVLVLSGDDGWRQDVIDMTRRLVSRGDAVAGVDTRTYVADIAAQKNKKCRYMAADFEALSHRVQREMGLLDYHVPLIYGFSAGATLAYAVLVQSPAGTFGGAVSAGFCPELKFRDVPLCTGPGAGLHYQSAPKHQWLLDPAPRLADPWIVLAGTPDRSCPVDRVARFVGQIPRATLIRVPNAGHDFTGAREWPESFDRAFERLSPRAHRPARAATVADLPLIELPNTRDPAAPLVVMLSGDGGWSGLDRGLAHAFNQRGLPVVGLSTLKYYWHARTPEQSAADITRVMQHYLSHWKRARVILVGYSFGADVLPFIVNRLPASERLRVQSAAMLGLAANASFEIRVTGWVIDASDGKWPIAPELARMQDVRAICLYGLGERADPCPAMAGPHLRAIGLPGGHHFDGNYDVLAAAILADAGVSTIPVPPKSAPQSAPTS